jgi:MYXO-CTERM domain-containing protein
VRSPSLLAARALALSVTTAAAALLTAPLARANGRFPTAQQLAPAPADPSLIPLMATFGVTISKDNGGSWGWVCENAVGYQSSENPTLGVTAKDAILISTFEGLGVSTDQGCTWTMSPTITDQAIDLVVEGTDPHSAFVLSSGYAGQDDAGSAYTSRVWVTHDDGATVTQVGANLDPDIIVETIDVAPSDGTRVYVSGTRRLAGVANGVLLRSTDGAATFQESDFPLVTGDAGLVDRAPYIAAVDPTNPDRVYVRVDNVDGTRLLVSDDGLATTRQVWQAQGQILGFALSADGTKVYVGGPNDGLYVTTSAALSFATATQVWPGQVQCLAIQGSRLLACSDEVSGFAVGASTDDGKTWTALLHLSCVNGPLACGASSAVTTQCGPLWAAQQTQLGGACIEDAGTDDSGAPADAGKPGTPTTTVTSSSGGGCSTSSPRGVGGTAIFGGGIALASLLAFARRRRRR